MIKGVVLLCLLFSLARSGGDFCWRDSYGRGVGKPLHTCKKDLEKNGALCYPKCKDGYYGVGPVCWAHCPSDMKDTGAQCQKHSYGRGVGKPLHTCKPNQDKNGALCYDKCRENFKGVGPVCWEHCKPGYHDDGALCRKNPHIYGKGCCRIFNHCKNKCPKDYHEDPCTCRKNAHIYAKSSHGRGAGHKMSCSEDQDENAGLCYPKAKPGYKGVGPVAWQVCTGETFDMGVCCTKKTYGRGAGVPMICAEDEQYDAGLCYKPCKEHYHGVGPVCWGDCPPGWHNCGAACAQNAGECASKIVDMVVAPIAMVGNIAGTVLTAGGAAAATKAAQTAAKIAKIAKKSANIAKKIAKYTKKIIEVSTQKGKPMSQDEAEQQAYHAADHVMENMGGGGEEDEPAWEKALDMVEMVDPTGAVSAAKAFIHPKCHQILEKMHAHH